MGLKLSLATFCKITFLIRGLKVGGIIPNPGFKINFEPLGLNEEQFVNEIFRTDAYKYQQM